MAEHRAIVHVFGPQTIRGQAGGYQHVHATGLVDCLDHSSAYTKEDQKPVVTIGRHLAGVLAEFPAAEGRSRSVRTSERQSVRRFWRRRGA